ncbi:inner-membrane translocator [Cellulomonas flavigena DSM 20109]|uniref:Inner-membrane translocator n=1 Tax=Cellulomonas flavigena (strain ATCC 482 / DSM 20109 / BCRC 11376 / JCM 18109 / NBRC 3775 / NCIMB 8073 / NRS 134) TaxID=446466 RepID=D5UL40_CELFN|nr:ABC transporter permease [Cellulomonas flavigena]ADG75922.1 inner-membrane translocator [Cellulomonas flavigena DSM 20109]
MTPTTPAAAPPGPSRAGDIWREVTHHGLFWPVLALVLLLLACGIASPGFLDVTVRDGHLFGQLVDLLRNSATPLLLALGMCLVIATGGIDLSVGAVMAIGLAVSLTYLDNAADPSNIGTVLTAVLLGLAVGALGGAFNGAMVAGLGIQPFIATMILMVAGRGIAMLITQGQITTVTSPPFKTIGSGFVLGIPTPVVIAVVAFVVVAFVVRRTALGMFLESIGINREASRLAGVRSRQTTWTVYVIAGLLAALAGLVYGAPTMAADANNIGLMKELDAIMVVVLGGTKLDGGRFYLGGLLVGAMLLSSLERAVIIFQLPSQTTPLFKALVLIVVCVVASPTLRSMLRGRRRADRAQTPASPVEPADAVGVTA